MTLLKSFFLMNHIIRSNEFEIMHLLELLHDKRLVFQSLPQRRHRMTFDLKGLFLNVPRPFFEKATRLKIKVFRILLTYRQNSLPTNFQSNGLVLCNRG